MSAARRREGGGEEGVVATLQRLWCGEGRGSTAVGGDEGHMYEYRDKMAVSLEGSGPPSSD